jgi:AraC-like DNA-binding protein
MELALISISSIIFLFSFFLLLKKRQEIVEVAFYFVWALLFTSLIISTDCKEVFNDSVINGFSLLFFVWLILLSPLLYTIVFNNLEEGKVDIKNYYLPFILFFINVFSLIYFSVEKDEKVFTYEVVENVMTYTNYIVILFIFPISTIYYSFKSYQIIGSFPSNKLLKKAPEKFYLSLFIFLFDLYILIWFLQNYFITNATIKGVLKIYYVIYFIVSFIVLCCTKKIMYKKSYTDAESMQGLFTEIDEKLTFKMEVERVYTNSNLNVKSLAKELETNEKYLSQLINKKYNVNFSNFINDYRITYSKKLLLDEQFSNYTIEAIGNLSGFNSKSGFNSTFKKNTGMTPTDYKKRS